MKGFVFCGNAATFRTYAIIFRTTRFSEKPWAHGPLGPSGCQPLRLPTPPVVNPSGCQPLRFSTPPVANPSGCQPLHWRFVSTGGLLLELKKKWCFVSTGGLLCLESRCFVSTAADFWNTRPAATGNDISSCVSDPPYTFAGGKDDGSCKLPQSSDVSMLFG